MNTLVNTLVNTCKYMCICVHSFIIINMYFFVYIPLSRLLSSLFSLIPFPFLPFCIFILFCIPKTFLAVLFTRLICAIFYKKVTRVFSNI